MKKAKPDKNNVFNIIDYGIGPTNYLFFALFTIPSTWLVFSPKWHELLLLYAIDSLAYFIVRYSYIKYLHWALPGNHKNFIPSLRLDETSTWTIAQKKSLIEFLFYFPWRFSYHSAFFSTFKLIPLTYICLYVWKYNWPASTQFTLLISLSLLNFILYSSMIYISSHSHYSSILHLLHNKLNWSMAFKNIRIPNSNKFDNLRETFILFIPSFFVVIFQASLLWLRSDLDYASLSLRIAAIGILALLLFCRMLYMWRKYLVGSLEHLFALMQKPDNDQQLINKGVSLHTYPQLARFDRTFNDLFERIAKNERELSALVLTGAEHAKFKTLGEISAFVVHDLSNPVNSLQFCIDEITNNPAKASNPDYKNILKANIDKCNTLISSLRAFIRRGSGTEEFGTLGYIHDVTVNILRTQYQRDFFDSVKFNLAENCSGTVFAMPVPELTQVLDNLYHNCLNVFLKHSTTNPVVSISLRSDAGDKISLNISDNGPGLALDEFESLSGFGFLQATTHKMKKTAGIGLKLTRRLVEQFGGSLELDAGYKNGACFTLTLPKQINIAGATCITT